MKKIIARFKSKCAETGNPINKGESMFYDYANKKCYSLQSERGKLETTLLNRFGEPETDFIPDPGEMYFDNFCRDNGI